MSEAMSEAMSEDRLDALEREHEERTRGAQDLAGMLGITAEAREPEAATLAEAQPEERGESSARRDEQGRFVGAADVAEHGAPALPTPNMGALILAHIDNDPSYLDS